MVSVKQVAETVQGVVEGDVNGELTTIGSLASAGDGMLSFYTDSAPPADLVSTAAAAVMLKAEHAALFQGTRIIVNDPYLAYARASVLFAIPREETGSPVHGTAVVSAQASIGSDVTIGPCSVIGSGTRIGDRVTIGSHVCIGSYCVLGEESVVDSGVSIYDRTRTGRRCRISSGVVLGSSGFGYASDGEEWVRIEQLGGVVIGDDVDIGANTTIDRGALEDTIIGNGVKLDNQIQIAHNVRVGDHTAMAGCVAIAGSAIIGKRCRLGGRASILGHLEIADDVTVNANSFVAGSIREPGEYSSMIPVQPAEKWRKTVAHLHRLDSLAGRIRGKSGKTEK